MTGQDPAARYMIDSVQTLPGGCIGLTPCPGSARFPSARESWQRDLGADFDVIAEWGAMAVVSLVQAAELKSPALDDLRAHARRRAMEWYHLPIRDAATPDRGALGGSRRPASRSAVRGPQRTRPLHGRARAQRHDR